MCIVLNERQEAPQVDGHASRKNIKVSCAIERACGGEIATAPLASFFLFWPLPLDKSSYSFNSLLFLVCR